MAQEPRELDPSLSARDRFGAALRYWRRRRGLSQAHLAGVLPVSPDQMAKFEKAERWPSRRAAEKLDAHLGAGGELAGLWASGEAERVAAPSMRTRADPAYVVHWTQMLGVLAAAGNAVGGRGLLDVVATEIGVISRYGASAAGQVAADFLSVQARWLEFGSWIADNNGDAPRATVWLKQAGETAGRARDAVFGAYVLMRRAQRACEEGRPHASLNLLAAVDTGILPPRIRVLVVTRRAQAHAALGDGPQARRSLGQAGLDAARDSPSDPAHLAVAAHGTRDYVLAHEGMCRLALDEPEGAVTALEGVLRRWPPTQRLDEGLFRAHLSLAHAAAGALDEAVDQARSALSLGVDTGSRRTMRIVGQVLDRDLHGAQGRAELEAQWTGSGGQGGS